MTNKLLNTTLDVITQFLTVIVLFIVGVVAAGIVLGAVGSVIGALLTSIGATINIAWYAVTDQFLYKHVVFAHWFAISAKYFYITILIVTALIITLEFNIETIPRLALLGGNILVIIGTLTLITPVIPEAHTNGYTLDFFTGFAYMYGSHSVIDTV